ncbi:J domain-containing protein [archaeon]|nr:MAG: J domain-containing protein [archaeon]
MFAHVFAIILMLTCLGVPKDATEKQITVAYKKLVLKYHPDRNVDDEYAALKYKAVQESYQTLQDPVRRKQYDSRDNTAPVPAPESAETGDAPGLGSLGKVFGAVMSRLGTS